MNHDELEQKFKTYERGYVQVDLDAIVANAGQMKAHIAPDTQIIGVIKTDGYGHGSVPIAHVLEPLDFIYGFAVATAEEAHILRVTGVKKPILILGYAFPYSYEMLAKEEVSPAVFRDDSIEELAQAAKAAGKPIKAHIKVDTGMGRIGIAPDREGLMFVKRLMQEPDIKIEGIFTHFAKADERDKKSTEKQFEKFMGFIRMIEEELRLHIPLKHCSNSAGIMELPKMNLDLVRAGIILYGLYPSFEVDWNAVSLKPALSLYSTIIYIKNLPAGESVSYGGLFTAGKDTRVATIPLGYGDGYPRGLSEKGYVLICGKRAPILGRVCMDQFMVDVSEIPEAKVGSKVTLLGFDGNEHISAEDLGKLSGRFNYELVCDLGKRLPRVYFKDETVVYVKDYHDDYK
ncbi:MAG: alanine racemase [Bacteroidales bacterium]|nr:alanine racemase [Lachnoclostridium sp.]MCM1383021.1 alanine racemase [Lachnoclostridium sp.]MCM1463924.1 alanine racemase [Bacteroidales bacterium]